MMLFQTRPQNLPITELDEPEILPGIMWGIYAPSALGLVGPPFCELQASWLHSVSKSEEFLVFLESLSWRVH